MASAGPLPFGTWLTRIVLVAGMAGTAASAVLIVDRRADPAAATAAVASILLLLGGHRANHGDGTAFDRMLDALADRAWDGAILGAIAWTAHGVDEATAAAALLALCASFLSSYIRARGASLGYTVEESHVTRGVRYALVVYGLWAAALSWTLWVVAALSFLAAVVRTTQVAKEEQVARQEAA
jgi:phosphatidylglycerophosphate synthase